MENDQKITPSKDQVVITSSSSSSSQDHDQTSTGGGEGGGGGVGGGDGGGGGPSQVFVVKSYECNFCKRGFTNAQALGGHMNIHRKDKAKIKQKQQPQSSSSPSPKYYNEDDDRSRMIKWPRINLGSGDPTYDHDDTATQQFLNMPSFVHNPPTTHHHGQDKTNTSQVLDEDLKSSELDLELRLGPHANTPPPPPPPPPPPGDHHSDSATTGTGTRKFF